LFRRTASSKYSVILAGAVKPRITIRSPSGVEREEALMSTSSPANLQTCPGTRVLFLDMAEVEELG